MKYESVSTSAEVLILKRPDFEAIPVTIADSVFVAADTIIKAGTPIAVDGTIAVTTDSGTKGVYTAQITTAATAGDKIIIEGVTYEAAATEDIAAKKFAVGANIAAQITSLLKMVVTSEFVVAAVNGATDKLGFTQKVSQTANVPVVSVTQAPSTGALVVGAVATVTTASTGDVTSNVCGIILHDVTSDNPNAAALKKAYLDKAKVESSSGVTIDKYIKAALPMIVFE